MKKHSTPVSLSSLIFVTASLLSSNVHADTTHIQNDQHVVGDHCTIFVNTKAEFPYESGLSAFGGAGSDEALQKIGLISGILKDRGYQIVSEERLAEFKLELSNGIQCVQTDGDPGVFEQWMLDTFDVDYRQSGRFSGRKQDGVVFENTAKRTSNGWHKKSSFRDLVRQIVSYCRKAK